jgi:glutamate dehydrogenase (NAD(P)+)
MATLLVDAQRRLEETCKDLNIREHQKRNMGRMDQITKVNFPIIDDNKSLQMIQAVRIQHSTSLGAAKGGLIISKDGYTIEDIKALSMLMTWKCALTGVPLGGASGIILADPKKLSKNELERVIRRFTSSMMNILGPDRDILGPDVGTSPQIMAWIFDTYSMNVGKVVHRVVTGKPMELGGVFGRDVGVGLGISYLLHEYSRKEFEEIRGQNVVIQGLGYTGKNFALAASDLGANIIAISDSHGGIYNPKGLDIDAIIKHKEQYGTLQSCSEHIKDCTQISNADLLTLKCDWLIPCATHSQITAENADKLRCRRIIEGANAAITHDADKILWLRDIPVIPDLVANAGGIIVSYFEYVQGFTDLSWDFSEVQQELKRLIVNMFNYVYALKNENDITIRQAAYRVAVQRVADSNELRGIYP